MCKEGDEDRKKKKAIMSNIFITGWNGERYGNYMHKQSFDLCVYKITKILILSNMRYHIVKMKVIFWILILCILFMYTIINNYDFLIVELVIINHYDWLVIINQPKYGYGDVIYCFIKIYLNVKLGFY
jgi:hypothetical protein